MPHQHRSFMGVLKGEEKQQISLRSSKAAQDIDNEVGISASGVSPNGRLSNVASSQKGLPLGFYDTAGSISGDSVIETPEGTPFEESS